MKKLVILPLLLFSLTAMAACENSDVSMQDTEQPADTGQSGDEGNSGNQAGPDDAGIDMPGNASGTEAWLHRIGIIE